MWLGGNCPNAEILNNRTTCLTVNDMTDCLGRWSASETWVRSRIRIEVHFVYDMELFRAMENRHKQVQGDYLFFGSPYSAFITRL